MFGRRGKGKLQQPSNAGAFAASSDEEDLEIVDDAFADEDEDHYEDSTQLEDITASLAEQTSDNIDLLDTVVK